MKTTASFTMDTEVVQLAKERYGNLSATINELLKTALELDNSENKNLFDATKLLEKTTEKVKAAKEELEKLEAKRKEAENVQKETYTPE